MNDDEVIQIGTLLMKTWPKKYTPDEAQRFAKALAAFPFQAVEWAVDTCLRTKKFRPSLSELLGMLQGKETRGTGKKIATFSDGLRAMPGCQDQNRSDAELIFDYFRWIYKSRLKRFGHKDADSSRAMLVAEMAGELSNTMPREDAARCAEWIESEDVFALADVREFLKVHNHAKEPVEVEP